MFYLHVTHFVRLDIVQVDAFKKNSTYIYFQYGVFQHFKYKMKDYNHVDYR
jgi:hypothetical protein